MGKRHKKHIKSVKKFKDDNKYVDLNDFSEGKVEENCTLIAIDTNIFIDLSHMNESDVYAHRRGHQAKFVETMYKLKLLAESGKYKFVIMPGVFRELNVHGMSEKEKEFMSKYCVYYEPVDKAEFARESVYLARKYISSGAMKESDAPVGDALIMAQASLAGINILTNNYKDFVIFNRSEFNTDAYGDIVPDTRIYDYEEDNVPTDVTKFNEENLFAFLAYKQRTRAIAIADVNEKNNLVFPNKNGFKIIPMPFTAMDYIGKKGAKSGLMQTEHFNTTVDLSKFLITEYEMGE